jgi:hypothetical protein
MVRIGLSAIANVNVEGSTPFTRFNANHAEPFHSLPISSENVRLNRVDFYHGKYARKPRQMRPTYR